MILTALALAACPVSDHWLVLAHGERWPQDYWESAYNRLQLDGDAVVWNGVAADPATLRRYAEAVATRDPQPLTILDGSHSDCAHLQRYAALLETLVPCDPKRCVIAEDGPGGRSRYRFRTPRNRTH